VIRPALMAAAAGTMVSGCATLGGNVAGTFSCRAPTGSCAPTTHIDQKATEVDEEKLIPPKLPTHLGKGVPSPARTLERTVRIVFPAYIDASGILHEEATAYAVVEGPSWAISPNNSSVFSRSPAPSSLREAVAGASAPVIEGLEPLPTQAPHPVDAVGQRDMPGRAALEAARAGHRIGNDALILPALPPSSDHPRKPRPAASSSEPKPGPGEGQGQDLPSRPSAEASDSDEIFTRLPPKGHRP
jgi:conjugal transfer pilus assembly protein TraV